MVAVPPGNGWYRASLCPESAALDGKVRAHPLRRATPPARTGPAYDFADLSAALPGEGNRPPPRSTAVCAHCAPGAGASTRTSIAHGPPILVGRADETDNIGVGRSLSSSRDGIRRMCAE